MITVGPLQVRCRVTFIVQGSGPVPPRLLSYSHAFPDTATDAMIMEDAGRGGSEIHRLRLATYIEQGTEPDYARCGWDIMDDSESVKCTRTGR